MRIIIDGDAERRIDEIDAWWRENRHAASDLFAEEFVSAIELLSASPLIGVPYRDKRVPEVRRLLLPATKHHVYYVVRADHVVVLDVCGTPTFAGPKLH